MPARATVVPVSTTNTLSRAGSFSGTAQHRCDMHHRPSGAVRRSAIRPGKPRVRFGGRRSCRHEVAANSRRRRRVIRRKPGSQPPVSPGGVSRTACGAPGNARPADARSHIYPNEVAPRPGPPSCPDGGELGGPDAAAVRPGPSRRIVRQLPDPPVHDEPDAATAGVSTDLARVRSRCSNSSVVPAPPGRFRLRGLRLLRPRHRSRGHVRLSSRGRPHAPWRRGPPVRRTRHPRQCPGGSR
jgi:hypothetical protein